MSFTLSCESTVDLPYSYVNGRNIPVLFYSYSVDGTSYPDDMSRDPEALGRFYQHLAEGRLPVTSQINEFEYEEFFEPLVRQGDLLHIAFATILIAITYGSVLLMNLFIKYFGTSRNIREDK